MKIALHHQVGGIYQWELSLSPPTVATLLSAVCIDRDDPNFGFLRHLLWGPKSWCIRFDGNDFQLWQFSRGNLYYLLGLPKGTIAATKTGCRVELRPDQSGQQAQLRYLVKVISIVVPPVAAVACLIALPPYFSIWIRIAGALAFGGWFALGFGRLMPWMARTAYTDFIDELFADHILPARDGPKTCPSSSKS